jgi:hypothetical protein
MINITKEDDIEQGLQYYYSQLAAFMNCPVNSTGKILPSLCGNFFSVLQRGGMFIHGVLNTYIENKAQKRVIVADRYSKKFIIPQIIGFPASR